MQAMTPALVTAADLASASTTRPASISMSSTSSVPSVPSTSSVSERVARCAVRSLHAELMLHPKPGLVSAIDSGSHADMNAALFMRSLFSLRGYFRAITEAGADDADFESLVWLGVAAERRMLAATGGINTHRGAIFCLGLLCAAAGRLAGHHPDGAMRRAKEAALPRAKEAALARFEAAALRTALTDRWGAALTEHCRARPATAHGTRAALVHGAGGARAQAAAGLPAAFDVALPVLRATLHAGRDWECARMDAFFALLETLDDTNVYHRGGATGAQLVRAEGARFRAAGGTSHPDWRAMALATHRLFMQHRLSPGGAADLLAATCLVHQLDAGTMPGRGSVSHAGTAMPVPVPA